MSDSKVLTPEALEKAAAYADRVTGGYSGSPIPGHIKALEQLVDDQDILKGKLASQVIAWRIMAGAAPSDEEAAVLRHCADQLEALDA